MGSCPKLKKKKKNAVRTTMRFKPTVGRIATVQSLGLAVQPKHSGMGLLNRCLRFSLQSLKILEDVFYSLGKYSGSGRGNKIIFRSIRLFD